MIDTKKLDGERTLSVGRPQGIGTAPVGVKVTRDGCFLLRPTPARTRWRCSRCRRGGTTCQSEKKAKKKNKRKKHKRDDRVHKSATGDPHRPHPGRPQAEPPRPAACQLVGRVPVASYPVAAEASPRRKTLVWLAAKGLGRRAPTRTARSPPSPNDTDDHINHFQYLPSIVRARRAIARFPTDATLRKLTPRAERADRARRTRSSRRPARRCAPGRAKIKHVFYIVRENRTYDQVLGDDARGDGDPNLTLFGDDITPNAHALARRFPLLDHVYANSEASIDGHFWTSARRRCPTTCVKNWHQNYGGRDRPYDFGVYAVTWPAKRFLFDRAEKAGDLLLQLRRGGRGRRAAPRQGPHAGRDAGGQQAARSPSRRPRPPGRLLPERRLDRHRRDHRAGGLRLARRPPARRSARCRASTASAHSFTQQLATGTVPAFNYLVLPNDHTNGSTPGAARRRRWSPTTTTRSARSST